MEEYFRSKNILRILVHWKLHLLGVVAVAIVLAAFFSSPLLRLKKPFRQEVVLLVIFAFLLVNNLFHILV